MTVEVMLAPAVVSGPYQVELPVFQGPLDVLLRLIEKEQLDISVVSLAQIADQFLEHVRSLDALQPDILADFLVIAARLVWIKSRLLLPQPRPAEEEEEDPGEALARQLREYKRFKEVAAALQTIESQGTRSHLRVAPPPELERHLAPCDISLDDFLKAALKSFAPPPPPPPPVATVVPLFTLTIQDQIAHIQQATRDGARLGFSELIRGLRNRSEIVVTLLAVLELIKRREVNAEQTEMFGEIVISRAAAPADLVASPPANGTGPE